MRRIALLLLLSLPGLGSTPAAKAQAVLSGCTREALKGITAQYFAALEKRDPSGLPLASNVKFTENGGKPVIGRREAQVDPRTIRQDQHPRCYTAAIRQAIDQIPWLRPLAGNPEVDNH
jgi:hypothetical protein